MISDALMVPLSAPCAASAVSTSPQWLQVIQAVGSTATTIGVLVALYIAVIRDPRKDLAEHRHHDAQMDALFRMKQERAGAHARKILPSCRRTPTFGDSWWSVRIDNGSHALTTLLAVTVSAIDTDGREVPDGCRPANGTLPIEEAFDRSVRAALSEPHRLERGGPMADAVKVAIRDALVGHIVNGWPRTVAPGEYAVMAYTAGDPGYRLTVTVDFEDEAGYRWRRTDVGEPRLIGTDASIMTKTKEPW